MTKGSRTDNNTSTTNQRTFILTYLREHGSATTIDFRNIGIMAPAPRILELRKRGYDIPAILETVIDHAGVKHVNVARYFLQGVNNG